MKTVITSVLAAALCGIASTAFALSDTDAANMLFLKQEEKLAHDVYQVLSQKWNHPTFANIMQSEQRHMEAVDGLIVRYGLKDSTPAEPGKFSIPELQDLYDELIVQGSESLVAALAGVQCPTS